MNSTRLSVSKLVPAAAAHLSFVRFFTLCDPQVSDGIVGSVAFFLPTITEVIANKFFRQSLPTAFLVSIVLAAIIPPALVLGLSGQKADCYRVWALGAFVYPILFDPVITVGRIPRIMPPNYALQPAERLRSRRCAISGMMKQFS